MTREAAPEKAPKRRWRRWLKWLLLAIATLALLAAGLVYWLLGSTGGSRWLLQRAVRELPADSQLDVGKVGGSVLHGLDLHDLQYRTDGGLRLTIDRLRVSIALYPLLDVPRMLRLDHVLADGVRVELPPSPEPPPEPEPRIELPQIELPLDVHLADGHVTDLQVRSGPETLFELQEGAFTAELDGIHSGSASVGNLKSRLSLIAPNWDLEASLQVRLRDSYPLQLEVESLHHEALVSSGVEDPVLSGHAEGDLQRLQVTAALHTGTVDATAGAVDAPMRLRAEVEDMLGDLGLQGNLAFDQFDLRQLAPAAPEIRLAGDVDFRGRPPALLLDLRVDAESSDYGNWQIRGGAGLPDGTPPGAEAPNIKTPGAEAPNSSNAGNTVILQALHLRRTDGPGELTLQARFDDRGIEVTSVEGELLRGRLHGQGRLDWQPEVAWDFDLRAEGLAPEEFWPDWPGKLSAQASMIGRRDAETADLEGTLQLRRLSGRLRGSDLSGSGEIGFGLDPAETLPEIEIANLRLNWGGTQLQAQGRLGLQTLGQRTPGQRTLGQPIQEGGWDLQWSLDAPDLARLQKLLPAPTPNGSDDTTEPLPLRGRLHSEGRLLGALDQPGIEASFELDQVSWGPRSVQSASGNVRAELRPGSPLRLQVQARQVRAPELASVAPIGHASSEPAELRQLRDLDGLGELQLLTLDADGTPGDHRLQLRVETASPAQTGQPAQPGQPELRWLELTLAGSAELPPSPRTTTSMATLPDFTALSWHGTVEQLRFSDPAAGTWSSRDATELSVAAGRWRLDELCLRRSDESGAQSADGNLAASGNLCAAGALQPSGAWRLDGRVEQLPLSLFASLLPPELGIDGDLDGNLQARGGTSAPAGPPSATSTASTASTASAASTTSGRLELTLGPGQLRLPSEPGLPDLRSHSGGKVQASLQSGVVHGDGRLDLDALGFIESRFQIPITTLPPPDDSREIPLRVQVRTELRDLRFLDALTPALDDVRGVLDADVTWQQTSAPQATLRGTARLHEAQAKVPALGIRLRDITLDAQADGSSRVQLEGTATSGGGSLQLTGSAYPPLPGLVPVGTDDEDPLLADLRVRGSGFLAQRSPELTLYISPDLQLLVRRQRIDVEGQVTVPRANFDLDAGQAAVPVSTDVVYVNDQPSSGANEPEIPIYSRLQVILGDEVTLRGGALSLQPRGQLMLIDQPGRATTAVGELVLETGTFTLYGNTLTLDGGTILYTGNPIDNPGLRLRAYRAIENSETRAGVSITGTAARPEIEIFTEPASTPSDSLAYLLTGRPLASTSSTDSSMLVDAAAKLGLRRGNLLLQRLGQKIGLEEAKIESRNNLEDTSLFLGKQLTDRLYVVYRVGLIEPVSTLQIRYRLSQKWSLRGTTSQGSGGEGSGGDLLYSVQ